MSSQKDIAMHDPWLVAVWPGMGSVSLQAGGHLLSQLPGEKRVTELDPREFFEPGAVEVKDGVTTGMRLPRNLIFEWRDPRKRHDLLVFLGEAQPASGGYRLCQQILDYAQQRGVRRFFTFAAMATQLHPSDPPRVFVAGTDARTLHEASQVEQLEILADGQIGGLNGVLLAAGGERKLEGLCLLGELPFFAAGVPNPRAAAAVLEKFCHLWGTEIDLAELHNQAQIIEHQLLALMKQLEQAARRSVEGASSEEGNDGEEALEAENQPPDELPTEPPEPRMDQLTARRIESMFEQASHDRAKAFELKRELDRLGVFKRFEDRFLDLFRKAG